MHPRQQAAVMRLFHRAYESEHPESTPLVFLHGLFGSSANWHSIAKRLAGERPVLSLDLRNHGRSPHADEVSYPAMASDVAETLDALGLESVDLVGHSMGGKVAMWLALSDGQRVNRLLVADIAPVTYTHGFDDVLGAMQAVPLDTIANRAEADAQLARVLPEPGLRGYLLQNLEKRDGQWRWRLNLEALGASVGTITGFPEPPAGSQFLGDTLFLHGGNSGYVREQHQPVIQQLFPYARVRALPGAGHWLYAEQPDAFIGAVRSWH